MAAQLLNQTDAQGRKQGLWKERKKYGLTSKGHYKDDLEEGLWEEYRLDDTLWSRGHYLHGKEHGLWEGYHENGTFWGRYHYHHGKLIKVDSEEALEGYSGFIRLHGQQAWLEITDRIPVGSPNWGFYWMLVNLGLI
jgi:hypothetical protein